MNEDHTKGDDSLSLSEYLTPDEWDAYFYVSRRLRIRELINALLEANHEFPGLDKEGKCLKILNFGTNIGRMKIGQSPSDYAKRLNNGRNFLKEKLPDLVTETDEVWFSKMREAESPDYKIIAMLET